MKKARFHSLQPFIHRGCTNSHVPLKLKDHWLATSLEPIVVVVVSDIFRSSTWGGDPFHENIFSKGLVQPAPQKSLF